MLLHHYSNYTFQQNLMYMSETYPLFYNTILSFDLCSESPFSCLPWRESILILFTYLRNLLATLPGPHSTTLALISISLRYPSIRRHFQNNSFSDIYKKRKHSMILNSFSACFYGYLVTKFNYIAGPTVCIVLIKFTQKFYL